MNIELKRQIDSWTEADKHQNVIDPLAELKAYNFYEEKVAHIIGI